MDNAFSHKEKAKLERLTISPGTAQKVDGWLDQIRQAVSGLRINRQKLVEWLIHQRSPELSNRDLSTIREDLFDEVAFAEWAVRELKKAKERGETLTLADVMNGRATGAGSSPEPKKKRSRVSTVKVQLPDGGAGDEVQRPITE